MGPDPMRNLLPILLLLFPMAWEAPGQTVSDADGNVYPVVTVGTQVWMAENLKTTRFSDSAGILMVEDTTAWGFLSSPARCWYANSSTYKDIIGALYNGLAVASGKLCPPGWHVPDTSDWDRLVRFLGGKEVAGGKLKSKGSLETGTSYWFTPNTSATNESGFSGLPGGAREMDGNFHYLFSHGYFWTSTPDGGNFLCYRMLSYNYPDVLGGSLHIRTGLSVRCIRNATAGTGEAGDSARNPFRLEVRGDRLRVSCQGMRQVGGYLSDLSGRTVMQAEPGEGSLGVDVGHLQPGLYFFIVCTRDSRVTFKFIKN